MLFVFTDESITRWAHSCCFCVGALPLFLLATSLDRGIKVPLPLVYVVQSFTFGGALLGITYGILSASWDPKRDGSLLGIAEFKENFPNVMNGLRKRQ